MCGPFPVDTVSTRELFMAMHYAEASIHIPDFSDETSEPLRTVSGLDPDATPTFHVGAFRGLAFALLFETVLVILGSLAWQIFRSVAH